MGNTITINNGLKIYDIADQNGEVIGQFKINPTDAKMVERYKKLCLTSWFILLETIV